MVKAPPVPKPSTITIGSHTFTLVEDDLRCHKDESLYGLTDSPKCQIIHCSTAVATEGQIKDTILHEALHAIFEQRGSRFGGPRALFDSEDHEELAVRVVTDGLYILLRDNPQFVRWLCDV